MGVARQTLSELINEKTGVSTEMPIRLQGIRFDSRDLAGHADRP
ncbi:MAG: hypothetical protein OXC41_01715 [Gammaproteobacteria bacterium]|nr:hypothetical protein [Gammaproteobacteria bacterium]